MVVKATQLTRDDAVKTALDIELKVAVSVLYRNRPLALYMHDYVSESLNDYECG